MKTSFLVLIGISLHLLCSELVRGQDVPEFGQLPALTSFGTKSLLPYSRLTGGEKSTELRFRRAIAATIRPNFAGAFTLVEASCGTGCASISVVDENHGRIFTRMPFFSLVLESPSGKKYAGLQYRLSSRLLIAEGWFDSTAVPGEGYLSRKYYEWTGQGFRLLKEVPLRESQDRN